MLKRVAMCLSIGLMVMVSHIPAAIAGVAPTPEPVAVDSAPGPEPVAEDTAEPWLDQLISNSIAQSCSPFCCSTTQQCRTVCGATTSCQDVGLVNCKRCVPL